MTAHRYNDVSNQSVIEMCFWFFVLTSLGPGTQSLALEHPSLDKKCGSRSMVWVYWAISTELSCQVLFPSIGQQCYCKMKWRRYYLLTYSWWAWASTYTKSVGGGPWTKYKQNAKFGEFVL